MGRFDLSPPSIFCQACFLPRVHAVAAVPVSMRSLSTVLVCLLVSQTVAQYEPPFVNFLDTGRSVEEEFGQCDPEMQEKLVAAHQKIKELEEAIEKAEQQNAREQAKYESDTISWVNNLQGTPPSLDSKGADAVVPEETAAAVHVKISPKRSIA